MEERLPPIYDQGIHPIKWARRHKRDTHTRQNRISTIRLGMGQRGPLGITETEAPQGKNKSRNTRQLQGKSAGNWHSACYQGRELQR